MNTMNRLKLLILASLTISLLACSPRITERVRRPAFYLTQQQSDEFTFPPAPAPGSELGKADLATMHEWEHKRTPEQCAEAMAQGHAYFEEFYGDISPFVKPMPKQVSDFFAHIRTDSDSVISRIKRDYKRPRPFRGDETLNPCLGKIGGYSYPSGHATIARVEARILSDIAPDKKDIFMARAEQAALNRVIGGVHYPSDIEAGKKMGDMIYEKLITIPSFIADRDSLRQYLQK